MNTKKTLVRSSAEDYAKEQERYWSTSDKIENRDKFMAVPSNFRLEEVQENWGLRPAS